MNALLLNDVFLPHTQKLHNYERSENFHLLSFFVLLSPVDIYRYDKIMQYNDLGL